MSQVYRHMSKRRLKREYTKKIKAAWQDQKNNYHALAELTLREAEQLAQYLDEPTLVEPPWTTEDTED